jgi:alpha-beta hydrolase superfamily lysophospholipase
MEVSDLARISDMHYGFSEKPKKKEKKVIEDAYKGYKVHKDSDHNILGLYNEDTKHLVINHRGSSKAKDWQSNATFAVGLKGQDEQYKSRVKETKKMIKAHPEAEKISLTGHSFGGGTALHAMQQSASISNAVDEVHVFNPATNLSEKKIEDKEHRRHLKNKSIIHRTESDVVSKFKTPFGKKKIINKGKKQGILEAHSLSNWY